MDRKLIARYAIRETLGVVVLGVALFWSAGQIDWWPAWAVIAVMSGWIMLVRSLIVCFRVPGNPLLGDGFEERNNRG